MDRWGYINMMDVCDTYSELYRIRPDEPHYIDKLNEVRDKIHELPAIDPQNYVIDDGKQITLLDKAKYEMMMERDWEEDCNSSDIAKGLEKGIEIIEKILAKEYPKDNRSEYEKEVNNFVECLFPSSKNC